MKRNRKAKILATLGPASSDIKIIEDLFVAGCDVFRLNFSHGDLETHRKNYDNIRSLEEKHNHASCILADLQGPKLRVGTFKNTKENLSGFCRNCLSKWYVSAAEKKNISISYDEAREMIYGMPYAEWKTKFQKEITPEQKEKFDKGKT